MGRSTRAKIEDYVAAGGLSCALAKALTQMKPDGRHRRDQALGAARPGRAPASRPATKWELCRQAAGEPKYIICNADEGDPGAFQDRGLIEGNPHGVLEGMLIGAYAIGASEGYVYIRNEYPLAVEMISAGHRAGRRAWPAGREYPGLRFQL